MADITKDQQLEAAAGRVAAKLRALQEGLDVDEQRALALVSPQFPTP